MIYFAFPDRTHIGPYCPLTTDVIWLRTAPTCVYNIEGAFILESGNFAENFSDKITGPEVHTVYGFESIPDIKIYDKELGAWVDNLQEATENWIVAGIVDNEKFIQIKQAYQAIQVDESLQIT